MASSSYPSQLACLFLQDHFGEPVQNVISTLLQRGKLTLGDLMRYCKAPFATVRNALLVLIQHNLVIAHSQDPLPPQQQQSMPPPSQSVLYEASLDECLLRLRFPRFVAHIRSIFGEEGQALFEELLEHGKLTTQQIVDQTIQRAKAASIGLDYEPSSLRDVFLRIVRGNYVYRTDSFGAVTPVVEEVVPAPKKRKTQSGAATSSNNNNSNDNACWRVNAKQFLIDFRIEACVQFMSERINVQTGSLLRAIMKLIRPYEKAKLHGESEPIGLDQILSQVADIPDLNKDLCLKCLDILCKDKIEILRKMGRESVGGSEKEKQKNIKYILNVQQLVTVMQQKTVEKIVEEKFDLFSARIFRLLLAKKQLEQKQVADMCMLPLKDARAKLYDLFTAGFVFLQEVPRSADHAPSRTIFLWNANLERILPSMLMVLYKSAFNVKKRLNFELEQGWDLMGRAPYLTEIERESFEKLQRAQDRLELALLHLDETIMLLKDF